MAAHELGGHTDQPAPGHDRLVRAPGPSQPRAHRAQQAVDELQGDQVVEQHEDLRDDEDPHEIRVRHRLVDGQQCDSRQHDDVRELELEGERGLRIAGAPARVRPLECAIEHAAILGRYWPGFAFGPGGGGSLFGP